MLSEKPWKLEAVLLLVAGLMFSWSLGLILSAVLGHWLWPQSPDAPAFHQFVLSTVSFHGVALVLAHVFLKQHQVRWRDFLGLTGPQPQRALLAGLLAAALMAPVALLLNQGCAYLLERVSVEPVEQPTVRMLQVSVGWAQRLAFGFGAIGLAPLVEEMLFRGMLYPVLKQQGYPRLALWGTALAFAAIHTNLLTFVPLTFLGLALAWLYEQTDNLLAPWLAHALFNALNFVLLVMQ